MLDIESLKLTDVELADCGYLPRLYPVAARKVADEQVIKTIRVVFEWMSGHYEYDDVFEEFSRLLLGNLPSLRPCAICLQLIKGNDYQYIGEQEDRSSWVHIGCIDAFLLQEEAAGVNLSEKAKTRLREIHAKTD